MKIHILDLLPAEQGPFREALVAHEVYLCESLERVPEDAQIISIFVDSRIGGQFLDEHPCLRLIATRSTTSDHIPLQECERRGITVCYVPTYGDYTVAEHTFALLLAIARKLRPAIESSRKTFSYDALRGFQLYGKTLGVIGTGRIGLHVLRLANAFGMRTIAYDLAPRPDAAREGKFEYVALDQLFQESQVISLHASLTPTSYHLLNKEAFSRCREGVVIINTARGALIDTSALLEALEAGIVSAAGLDVLEDERVMRGQCTGIISSQIIDHLHGEFKPAEPRVEDPQRVRELTELVHNEALLDHPNVVFTPHIGFNSVEAVERINRTTIANIQAFLSGLPINVLAGPRAVATEETQSLQLNLYEQAHFHQ